MAWNEPGGNPKDPWGGNNRGNNDRGNNGNNGGGGNQPPDLDQAIKDLMNKLSGLFGGGNNNNGSGSKNSGGGSSMFAIAAVIVAIVLLFQSVYTLDEKEQGVVLRLGEYIKTENPGLRFKIPLIDTVIPVTTTTIRSAEVRERMLTQDENIVEVELNLQYQVFDPVAYALRIARPEHTILVAGQSALRHEVGSMRMDAILTIGRVELASKIEIRLQEYLDRYQTGMRLTNINIKDTRPPAPVSAAFDDVQKAKQDKERIISEAQAYANAVIPEARGRAQRLREDAEAYKQRVVVEAEGEAARFMSLYSEYQLSPKVMRERMYIDAISNVYNQATKVMVDVEGGNNMMYIPLDQLMKNMPQSSGNALSTNDVSRLTDQVLQEVRTRQGSTNTATTNTIRREGR